MLPTDPKPFRWTKTAGDIPRQTPEVRAPVEINVPSCFHNRWCAEAAHYIATQAPHMIGSNEELTAAEAAMALLSTDPNSNATIKLLRQAKYVAALAMTTLASDKPLNDARHAVVTTLSDLVHALETDPTPQQQKIEKAKDAIRILVSDLKAKQELRLRRLAAGD
jgi:hypothetical protein